MSQTVQCTVVFSFTSSSLFTLCSISKLHL